MKASETCLPDLKLGAPISSTFVSRTSRLRSESGKANILPAYAVIQSYLLSDCVVYVEALLSEVIINLIFITASNPNF